jgi:hypothetical protein
MPAPDFTFAGLGLGLIGAIAPVIAIAGAYRSRSSR